MPLVAPVNLIAARVTELLLIWQPVIATPVPLTWTGELAPSPVTRQPTALRLVTEPLTRPLLHSTWCSSRLFDAPKASQVEPLLKHSRRDVSLPAPFTPYSRLSNWQCSKVTRLVPAVVSTPTALPAVLVLENW